MRLSTAGFHRSTIDAILDQQSAMAKTQEQVSTGKRFTTASEDPIAAARVASLNRALADNTQYGRNSDMMETRLSYEEQTLSDMSTVLQQVRELAVQGASTTLSDSDRETLANDVREKLSELMDLANTKDANGEYLFSGTSTSTKPFVQTSTGVSYQGDSTNRQVRISSTQSLADSHSGEDAFMNIKERNGVFTTNVTTTNTGGATIDVGTVSTLSQWVPDNYSLQFTSATDWQVVDDTTPTPNVIASGSGFTDGDSVSFNGVTVTITGTPAAGDSFSITPAQGQDLFAMVEDVANALELGSDTDSDAAVFSSRIGATLANLDQALDRVSSVRSEVGSRLNAIDNASSTREDEAIDLQALVSDLQDVDYAEAVSKLNLQYTGLQAAQSTYTSIAQLSLFDYL